MPKENVPISKGLILFNSGCQVLTHVLNLFVLVWVNQFLIRRLSTEEYSLYPLVILPLQFVPILTNVLTGGLARFSVEAYSKGDNRRITEIVSTMTPLMLGAGVLLMVLQQALSIKIDVLLDIDKDQVADARTMLFLLFCAASFKIMLSPQSVGLYVRQKFYLQSAVNFGGQIVRLSILAALLYGHSTRVLWVVVSTVISEVLVQIAMVWISKKQVPALKFRFDHIVWKSAKGLTSFGIWNSVQQISQLIRKQADILILSHFATKTDVAAFFLGSLVFNQMQRFTNLGITPLAPPLVALHAKGDKKGIAGIYLRGGRFGLWIALMIAPALIIYRRELVQLYVGPEKYFDYVDSATIMALLMLVPILRFGNVMLGQIAPATNKIRPAALVGITLQSINLLLTFYFVGYLGMGAVGSALATVIAVTTLQPLLSWPLGRQLAGVGFGQWLRKTMWPGLRPGLCAALVWVLAKALINPTGWLELSICVSLGLAVYLIVLVFFCFEQEDKDDFRQVSRKIRQLLKVT